MASAGPLTREVDSLLHLEQAGAAAAVLPSLFAEQIEHEEQEISRLYDFQSESFAESLSYFPEPADYGVDYGTGPDEYLQLVESAKQRLSIPIIGSLNGHSAGSRR